MRCGIEGEELEHEGDVAVAGFKLLHRLAIDEDVARVDILQPGNGAQRRGLAATGRPEEHHELPVLDRQIELSDDVNGTEVFLDVPEDDLGHEVTMIPGWVEVLFWRRC